MNRLSLLVVALALAGSTLAPLAAHAQSDSAPPDDAASQVAPDAPDAPDPAQAPDASSPAAPSDQPNGSSVVPAGWRAVDQSADGYRLALPPTWRQIDLDPTTVSNSVTAVAQQDPQLSTWLNNQTATLIASNVHFFAIDFAPEALASGSATSLNVISQSVPASVSLDLVVQVSAGQLENLPGVVQPIAHRRVALPAGAAERFDYSISVGSQNVATTQFILLAAGRSYVLTFSTSPDKHATYAPTFDQIAQTFEPIG